MIIVGPTNDPIYSMTQVSEFSDADRQLLRDSVRGFLSTHWPSDQAVPRISQPDEVRKVTKLLAGQGLTALGADPAAGGVSELVVVQEEMGRAACPAPVLAGFLANQLLASVAHAGAATAALRTRIESGEALVAIGFGSLDGDRTAGQPVLRDQRLTGECRYLDVPDAATHVLVALPDSRLAIVETGSQGVLCTPTRTLGAAGLGTVEFLDAPVVEVVQTEGTTLEDAVWIQRLGFAARAYGAAQRAFDLIVQYAKERKQFGRLIGSFQAIQHKLANNHIALNVARLAVASGASEYDRRQPEWRVQVAAACVHAHANLRQVSLETQHAFGAIGYAEEHEAPRHFKRVHQDVLRLGGDRTAKEKLAHHFLDDGKGFPDYDLGPTANALRQEVRDWLKKHWTPERRAAMLERPHGHREFDPDFARELGQTGWLGLDWPVEYGGRNCSALEYLGFVETMEAHAAPRAGAPIQATSWLLFGSEEQKRRYLPELLRGEVTYGLWFSEPDSGSDLASIKTRAVQDGDHFVVNGQKIWTTSYWGEYMWLAVRTDPDAKPAHAGLSLFCVPTNTPGLTIRPVQTMYDGEFINTFFDNVRIPKECLVGELNGGWKVITGSLISERGIVAARILAQLAHSFVQVCDYIREARGPDGRPLSSDPVVRNTIASFASQLEVGRQVALDCAVRSGQGELLPDVASMTKVYAGELFERFYQAAQEIIGMEASLSKGSKGAILLGKLEQKLRHSLMWVISIGTNEIQRNQIAIRGLELPSR